MKSTTLTLLLCLGIFAMSDSMKEQPGLIAAFGMFGGGAFVMSALAQGVD